LKNSNASKRHARDCQPTPGQARTGVRRSGTRSARASATNAGLAATYVPTHERPITWDICPEPRHLLRHRRVATEIARTLGTAIPACILALLALTCETWLTTSF
jgi:hypothetical protein